MERPVLVALQRCALALLLLAPAGAQAQLMPLQDDPFWGPRLRVTPSIGWMTGVGREEIWTVDEGEGPSRRLAQIDLAGGPAAALTIEYQFAGPFSALLGGMYVQRDDASFTVGDADPLLVVGSTGMFAKAGVAYRFNEGQTDLVMRRLGASAFVAPFYMNDKGEWRAGLEDTDLFNTTHQFGINFGVTGELPFAADRFALQLGFEDYFTFWDQDALDRLPRAYYDTALTTDAEADPSHQWVVRAGLSFRFR